MTQVTEKLVDGLYRYVLEWEGYGVMQDYPRQQDLSFIEKKFKEEITRTKEEKERNESARTFEGDQLRAS